MGPGDRSLLSVPGRAVFPGSFDPLTVAHVAVADAVRAELSAVAVDLVISRLALDKGHGTTPAEERITAILGLRAARPWLGANVTDAQLLADIAEGYDVLVLGADKWHQLRDERFYGSRRARDEALARLPTLAVAPRAGVALPSSGVVHVLGVPEAHRHVSSTAVRDGRSEWRAPT